MKQHNFRMSPYFFFSLIHASSLLPIIFILCRRTINCLPSFQLSSGRLFFLLLLFFWALSYSAPGPNQPSAGYRLTIFSIVVIHQCLLNNLHRPHSLCKRQSKSEHNRQIVTKENSLILLFYHQVVSFDFFILYATL